MSFTVERPVQGLVICQPRRGFRYGAEAFWLTGFALEGAVGAPALDVLDLGTGSGVIAGLFAARGARAVGVDVRAEWLPLWSQSVERSELPGTLDLRLSDVRDVGDAVFDLVVSNPPFFRGGTGPVSADPWKAAARTESTASLADFVATAARSLSARGSACWVLPVDRREHLLHAARQVGLHARREVYVGRRRWLADLRRDPGEVVTDKIDEGSARAVDWYARASGAR